MSEFGRPQTLALRSLVGGEAMGSPTGLSQPGISPSSAGMSLISPSAAELRRRQAEYEREIDLLDKQELELNEQQLRQFRETTASFAKDIAQLRREVTSLKQWKEEHLNVQSSIAAESTELRAILAKQRKEFEEALEREVRAWAASHNDLESRCAELTEGLEHHGGLHQHKAGKLDDLHNSHNSLKELIEGHVSEFKNLHGSFHKDRNELGRSHDDFHQKLEKMAAEHERLKGTLHHHKKGHEEALNERHLTIEERLAQVERQLKDSCKNLDSTFRHTAELLETDMTKLKGDISKFAKQRVALEDADGALGDRVQYIEKLMGDSLEENRHAHKLHKGMHDRHTDVETRIEFLEKSFGDNAENHWKELEAVKKEQQEKDRQLENMLDAQERHKREMEAHKEHIKGHLDAHKDELHGHLAKHKEDLHGHLSAHKDELHGHLASHKDELHGHLSSHKDELAGHIGELHGKHDALHEKHQAAHGRLDELHAGVHSKIDELHAKHDDKGVTILDHHANVNERLDYIESLLNDSADKHEKELEDLKNAHASMADAHNEKAGAHASMAEHHSSMAERLDYIESLLNDSADKHAAELEALKGSHGAHADHHETHATGIASALEKIAMLEHKMEARFSEVSGRDTTSADLSKFSRPIEELQRAFTSENKVLNNTVDRLERRLDSMQNETGVSVAKDLDMLKSSQDKQKVAMAKQQRDMDALKEAYLSQDAQRGQGTHLQQTLDALGTERRIEKLEAMMDDATQTHSKRLERLKAFCEQHEGDLDELRSKHASHGSAMEKMQKGLRELADKHEAHSFGTQGTLEQLRGVLGGFKADLSARHDSLEGYLGDSLNKLTEELEKVKDAHARHVSTIAGHLACYPQPGVVVSSVDQRLDRVELAIQEMTTKVTREIMSGGQNADGFGYQPGSPLAASRARAMDELQAQVEHLASRLRVYEKQGAALGDLRKAVTGLTAEQASHELETKALVDRVERMEGALGAHKEDMHNIKAAHDKQVVMLAKCAREVEAARAFPEELRETADRVKAVEESIHSHAERSAQEVAHANRKIDQLHHKLTEDRSVRDTHVSAIHGALEERRDHQEAMAEDTRRRMERMEGSLSDQMQRLAREFSTAKQATVELYNQAKDRDMQAQKLTGRVELMEGSFHKVTNVLSQKEAEAEARLDQVTGRLSLLKDAFGGWDGFPVNGGSRTPTR